VPGAWREMLPAGPVP